MIDDIKLPPLPYPHIPGNDYDPRDMWDYARAAIKAYRQQCGGEPVAYAVFADNGNIRIWQHEPLEWPEAVPLYSAPAQEPIVPKGWKLVPVQPTHRMLTQMLCGSATPEANYTDFWERCYQAMLAAAPKFGEEE